MVDFPVSGPAAREPFPWRAAALAATAIAAVELVLLVLVGGTLIAKPDTKPARTKTAPAPAATPAAPKTTSAPTKTPTAELPRRKVEVMILNGNGRTGAAASASAKIRSRGYRVGVVGNAPRQDYPRSIVMFRPGFAGEAARLARDLGVGVGVVGPLDGMRPRQLAGAHAVVILGG